MELIAGFVRSEATEQRLLRKCADRVTLFRLSRYHDKKGTPILFGVPVHGADSGI